MVVLFPEMEKKNWGCRDQNFVEHMKASIPLLVTVSAFLPLSDCRLENAQGQGLCLKAPYGLMSCNVCSARPVFIK